jgi:hypothetical protein
LEGTVKNGVRSVIWALAPALATNDVEGVEEKLIGELPVPPAETAEREYETVVPEAVPGGATTVKVIKTNNLAPPGIAVSGGRATAPATTGWEIGLLKVGTSGYVPTLAPLVPV